jgi:hypothetical protein
MLKTLIGLALILAGVLGGIYVGLIWLFIGGIIQIVTELKSDDIQALSIAWGIAKIILASPVGSLLGYFGVFLGLTVLTIK